MELGKRSLLKLGGMAGLFAATKTGVANAQQVAPIVG